MANPSAVVKKAFDELAATFEDEACNDDGSPQFVTVEWVEAFAKAAEQIKLADPVLAVELLDAAELYEEARDNMQEVWAKFHAAAGRDEVPSDDDVEVIHFTDAMKMCRKSVPMEVRADHMEQVSKE